jgi:hypothetical protein
MIELRDICRVLGVALADFADRLERLLTKRSA